MVDEREDRYEGEEGEYHFSDDQVNYDEVEAPKGTQSTTSMKKTILDKFSGLSPSRRMLLAGVVFVSLIAIVYKMLLPSSSTLSSEITQVTPVKVVQTTVTTKSVTPVIQSAIPVAQPITMQPSPVVTETPQVSATLPPNGAIQPGSASPIELSQMPGSQPGSPPAQTTPFSTTSTSLPPPIAATQNVVDRVKAVEDHNVAIMNLLQTEYAQKMSEFEMQSNLVRGKMDEMAKRVNRIESSLNQITQLLQQGTPSANKSQAVPMENAPLMPVRSAIPRVTYTVQAIIPGRAWLKADSGDTVTVAEGDTLRDYGRITKIDPYDGVVEIDTGNKIIALSYGMSAE
jgi:hypothetical protein